MKAIFQGPGLAAVLVMSGLACSSSNGQPQGPLQNQDVGKCSELSQPAINEVLAVVAQNATCTTDADCTNVGLGSKCFDICTRAVNRSGVEAVNAASRKVGDTTCKPFLDKGCRVIPPPCAPPSEAACKNGKCI
jgi:hypothetical protein